MIEIEERKRIATVTVFTPPAVPDGEPPMNMSNKKMKEVASLKFSCGIVKNPAVRVVTDWNNDAIT